MKPLPIPQKIVQTTAIYSYKRQDVQKLLSKLESSQAGAGLLYQLPTGGGTTVMFSEIAKHYIQNCRPIQPE